MLKVTLEEIMSDHPVKVKETVSVGNVAHLLLRYRINGIIVVKEDDENCLAGIFTTSDLLRLLDQVIAEGGHRIEELHKVAELPVGQFASKNIISLEKDTPLAKVIAIMHKENVHTIPVYDKTKLVGVIGRHDVLNAALG